MRVLILGYSSIVQRRVLPALARLGVTTVDIATKTRAQAVTWPAGMRGECFTDYETALDSGRPDLVYVSTVNTHHARWAEEALLRGRNVVVDKPACLALPQAERLLELAAQQNVCLAEAAVFGYHPQIVEIRRIFADAGSRPTRISGTFSFPPLAMDNFRYRESLGGGALFDLGVYALGPGRLFFGAEPREIICRVVDRAEEVETSFSVMAIYPGGRSLVGNFGFNTGYRNHLEVLGPQVVVALDNVFTTPANLDNVLYVNRNGEAGMVSISAADPFEQFLQAVFRALDSEHYEALAQDFLANAQLMHRLRRAAATG